MLDNDYNPKDIEAVDDMSNNLYFVYGSLKKGFPNSHFMDDSIFIRATYIEGYKLYDTGSGYPFVIKTNDSKDKVYGEVYSVNYEEAQHIDRLEGYNQEDPSNSLYIKELTLTHGSRYHTYVYVGNQFNPQYCTEVESGKWNKKLI